MIETAKRIKWKNIIGLFLLVAIVFAAVYAMNVLNVFFYGDCVEKSGTKVCFSVERSAIERNGTSVIHVDTTNVGTGPSGALIVASISPNLENRSPTVQEIRQMAPGDTVKRVFTIAAKNEEGQFKIGFDIDMDYVPDKEIFLTVK